MPYLNTVQNLVPFYQVGNIRKAEKRVSNVPATTIATVMTISKLVKMYTSPLIRYITYYKHTPHRGKHKQGFSRQQKHG